MFGKNKDSGLGDKEAMKLFSETQKDLSRIAKRISVLTGGQKATGMLCVYQYESLRRMEELQHRFADIIAMRRMTSEDGLEELYARAAKEAADDQEPELKVVKGEDASDG